MGLSIGMAASFILFLLIQHHTSFDVFNTKYDRIYRVVTKSDGNTGSFHTPGVPTPLPPAFRQDFSEAEEVIFTQHMSNTPILVPQKNGENKKYEEERGVVVTEPGVFKIFDRDVLEGDASRGLDEPNESVISSSLAKKYFGHENVIGEIIRYRDVDYTITAVVADPPNNTDLPFTLFLSYETIRKENEAKGWGGIWSDEHCYFLLKEGETIAKLESRMAEFYKKYNPGENYDNQQYILQPLSDLHFDDRYGNYNYNTVSKTSILALAIVGVFLILTSSINFINLTTAEAIKRSKEVGIRKTLGSSRSQLIFQFLGETSLVTLLSMILALGMAQLALSFLNPFLDLSLSFTLATNTSVALFGVGLFVVVSFVSGLYPAFIVSSFKPALALKNSLGNKNSSGYWLRRSLVVVQFFISQFLIIATIVLISQMNYFRSKELGFKQDAIINLPIPEQEQALTDSTRKSKMRTLANELSRLTGVEKYSLCNYPPSSGSVNSTGFLMEGDSEEKRIDTQVKTVDDKYVDLYDLTILAGQNIGDFDTAQSVIVNRRLASLAGFSNPQEIIGKRITIWRKTIPVAGVVENFHTTSLADEIEPAVLLNRIRNYRSLSLQINPQSFQTTLPQIQNLWEQAYPNHLFSYEFLDDSIRQFYAGQERESFLLMIFTALAIFIGCLGLFGLATFMINQKNKEIGVRKVLGATVQGIILLFAKEYMKLIILGFALAAPLAWFVMNEWLSNFAYRIDVTTWIFLTGIGTTLLIALVTVGYRSIRAAIANPVDSLRYE